MSPRRIIPRSQNLTQEKPEEVLDFQLRASKIHFKRQVKFHPLRKWRADFIIEDRLLVEVEGGLYIHGGHNRGAMIEDTMEKLAEASMMGYFPLRVSTRYVKNGKALQWIEKLLKQLRG